MRIAVVVLFLFGTCYAQQAERAKAEELLEIAYRSQIVMDLCARYPDDVIDVMIDGYTIPVDCYIWKRWLESQRK